VQTGSRRTDRPLWSGEVPADLRDEFRVQFKAYRKEYRRAMRKWEKMRRYLAEKKAAPEFANYLRSKQEQHEKTKPTFDFVLKV